MTLEGADYVIDCTRLGGVISNLPADCIVEAAGFVDATWS
jgi:alpha-galactosidase/6-phospho-beta-glucosidase family protein